jgi:hypothetical protein
MEVLQQTQTVHLPIICIFTQDTNTKPSYFPQVNSLDMELGMVHRRMVYLATYLAEMKECDAPESNKTDAGAELTRNIHSQRLEPPERSPRPHDSHARGRSSADPCCSAASGCHF